MAGRAIEAVPVTWRDGVHITGTPIWCDALRTRDICFVSSAHALGNPRHGQLIASAATLTLLGPPTTGTRLPVPYGRPFTLGAVRLELIRSGHGLGGASLLLEVDGYRVLYAAAVCPEGGGLGGTAESRACDTLVLGAHYGDPSFRFPPVADEIENVAQFVARSTAAGAAAVLLVSTPSKALDVAARLHERLGAQTAAGAQPSLFAQRIIHDAAHRLRAEHHPLPPLRRFAGKLPTGHVLLWLRPRQDSLPVDMRPAMRVALVSGEACAAPAGVGATSLDAAFAWSDQTDYRGLLGYIDACAPQRVFLIGTYREPLAAALDRPDRPCSALGPPRQIELFRASE